MREARLLFDSTKPTVVFEAGDQVELWDALDFPPWEALRRNTLRIFRCRQPKPNGSVVEAYWLMDFTTSQVGPRSLFRLAKSRWEIENQGFNDAKNRHGIEHIADHHQVSLLVYWLIAIFALTTERLYRQRYLHRGNHHHAARLTSSTATLVEPGTHTPAEQRHQLTTPSIFGTVPGLRSASEKSPVRPNTSKNQYAIRPAVASLSLHCRVPKLLGTCALGLDKDEQAVVITQAV